MLISLSGSFQTAPTFWLDPRNGVSYNVVTQTPQYQLTSLERPGKYPDLGHDGAARPEILGDVASTTRGAGMARALALQRAARDRYLRLGAGSRPGRRGARHQSRSWTRIARTCRAARSLMVRGQIETMQSFFPGTAGRPGAGGGAGVSADRGEFPILAGPVHHHHGAARGAGRDRDVPVRHPHHPERAGADGRDHERGSRHGQQHSGGQLRQGASGRSRRARNARPSRRASRASGRC